MSYSKSFNESNFTRLYIDGSSTPVTAVRVYPTSRQGSAVPDRDLKIRAGSQAGSYYKTDRYDVERWEPGSVFIRLQAFGGGAIFGHDAIGMYANSTPSSITHLLSSTVAVESKALSNIYGKIREVRSHLNGQTLVGELRKTIQGLRKPGQALWKAVDKYSNQLVKTRSGLRSRHPAAARNAMVDAASGLWLEAAFGLAPVISDTRSLAEAIARFEIEPPRRVSTRSSSQEVRTVDTFGKPFAWNHGHNSYILLQDDKKVSTTSRCGYVVGIRAVETANFPAARRLADVCGFTPENFVPTLYELAPYSWLADYFSNLGDIIEAGCTNTSDVTWITKSVSRRTTQSMITRAVSSSSYAGSFGYRVLSWGGPTSHIGMSVVNRTTFERTLPSSLGIPTLVFNVPGSGAKIANLTALLAQQRKILQF